MERQRNAQQNAVNLYNRVRLDEYKKQKEINVKSDRCLLFSIEREIE